jgi:serine/threonine protein kinase
VVAKKFQPEEFKEKRIGPDQFIAHQLLGTGSFGEVYLVEKISSKRLYAMKVLTKSKIKSQNLIKYALTERNVMSVMHHSFIVRLRYAFQT